ncbi:chromosome segregation ATPase [Arthrobacter sp. UYP6]|uniref:hypothetical protein n=1 Tax=Arthrobacter sp. UYP6 TaxID=1756378 RepID=UPI003393B9DF
MDATSLAAFGALGVALIGFASTLTSKKIKAPEDKAVERRDTIAERDSLIDSFKEDITALKADVKAQKAETAELREEIQAVRDHNNVLITYCYRLLAIIRKHGHEAEIPSPPPSGIHL